MSLLAASGFAMAGNVAVNADSAIIQDFEKRVDDYLKLRRNSEAGLTPPKTTASPEKITHHQVQLAHAVRKARVNAKQGDVFTPPIAMEFRRLLQIAMQPQDAPNVRQSLRHAEPVQVRLRVGDAYPPRLPLQSTPPTILQNLPMLPPEIEYRITGRDLVLLDIRANLVIDIINGVFS